MLRLVQRGISAPILAMWRPGRRWHASQLAIGTFAGGASVRWCAERRCIAREGGQLQWCLSFPLLSSARPFLALESRAARLRCDVHGTRSESFTLSLGCGEVGRYLWRAARGVSEAFESAASETRPQGQTSPASIERTFDSARFPNSTSGAREEQIKPTDIFSVRPQSVQSSDRGVRRRRGRAHCPATVDDSGRPPCCP